MTSHSRYQFHSIGAKHFVGYTPSKHQKVCAIRLIKCLEKALLNTLIFLNILYTFSKRFNSEHFLNGFKTPAKRFVHVF